MNQAPTDIFVRPSTPDEQSIIETHRRLAIDESRQYRGVQAVPETGTRDQTFVAGVGTSIFGSVSVTEISPARWNITHVFVERDAREIGIGDALMLHTLKFLRQENAEWCESQSQPGDRSLKNLFERHGLVAQTIVVGRSLSDLSTEAGASQ